MPPQELEPPDKRFLEEAWDTCERLERLMPPQDPADNRFVVEAWLAVPMLSAIDGMGETVLPVVKTGCSAPVDTASFGVAGGSFGSTVERFIPPQESMGRAAPFRTDGDGACGEGRDKIVGLPPFPVAPLDSRAPSEEDRGGGPVVETAEGINSLAPGVLLGRKDVRDRLILPGPNGCDPRVAVLRRRAFRRMAASTVDCKTCCGSAFR